MTLKFITGRLAILSSQNIIPCIYQNRSKTQQYHRNIAIIFTCLCSIPTTIAIKITTSNFIKITNCRLREFATWIKYVKNTIRSTFFRRLSERLTNVQCSIESIKHAKIPRDPDPFSLLYTCSCVLCAPFSLDIKSWIYMSLIHDLSSAMRNMWPIIAQATKHICIILFCVFQMANLCLSINREYDLPVSMCIEWVSFYISEILIYSVDFFCFSAQYDFVCSAHILCV